MEADGKTALVEMKDISIAFGGLKAVDHVSVDLYPGEVVGLLGHNGAGKSCLIKILSGAYKRDEGSIRINGQDATINNPRDAKSYGIETIYQTLALADNIDAASNLYLGREILTRWGTLDDSAMEAEARKVMGRLNPNFRRFKDPVTSLSGGQRQSVAIARAIHFNARILIMDEPTAALGPHETAQVGELIKQLKSEGIGIFLISHDIHDVFDLADRVAVMKNGQIVGIGHVKDLTKDDVLGMIILGKCPPGAVPGPARHASSVNQTTRSTAAPLQCSLILRPVRDRSRGVGMRWRCSAWYLSGKAEWFQGAEGTSHCVSPPIRPHQDRVRATTSTMLQRPLAPFRTVRSSCRSSGSVAFAGSGENSSGWC